MLLIGMLHLSGSKHHSDPIWIGTLWEQGLILIPMLYNYSMQTFPLFIRYCQSSCEGQTQELFCAQLLIVNGAFKSRLQRPTGNAHVRPSTNII